jgi:hypothetical protein
MGMYLNWFFVEEGGEDFAYVSGQGVVDFPIEVRH